MWSRRCRSGCDRACWCGGSANGGPGRHSGSDGPGSEEAQGPSSSKCCKESHLARPDCAKQFDDSQSTGTCSQVPVLRIVPPGWSWGLGEMSRYSGYRTLRSHRSGMHSGGCPQPSLPSAMAALPGVADRVMHRGAAGGRRFRTAGNDHRAAVTGRLAAFQNRSSVSHGRGRIVSLVPSTSAVSAEWTKDCLRRRPDPIRRRRCRRRSRRGVRALPNALHSRRPAAACRPPHHPIIRRATGGRRPVP